MLLTKTPEMFENIAFSGNSKVSSFLSQESKVLPIYFLSCGRWPETFILLKLKK